MEKQTNRRTLLKGATAVAAAAMTKRSTAFAAPAVVQSTGLDGRHHLLGVLVG